MIRGGLPCLLLLAACGVEPAAGSAARAQPIVGGVDDADDPAVVSVTVGGFPACTGTLVSSTAVLTAGHCANVLGAQATTEVRFGSVAASSTRRVVVAEQRTHPQYIAEGKPYDFAMLRLTRPVTDVTPVPLGTQALSDADVGAPIRHVGFGVSDEAAGSGRGTKRQVTFPITRVEPLVVWSVGQGAQTCSGDSGGPGLLARGGEEQVVAVVSDGPDCSDAGWDGRVDAVADWICATAVEWAPDAGLAPARPKTGCASGPGSPELLGVLSALGLARRRGRKVRQPAAGC